MSKVCRYEQDMLNQLPPELREACRKVWQENLDEKQYIIQHKYNLGLLVKQTLEFEETHPDQRGNLAKIQQIIHASSKRVLDRAYRLVTLFTPSDIKNLTQVNQSGFCISWSHFEYIMVGYLTKEKMISYLLYARKYSIAPRELYEIVKKEYCRSEGVGRPKKAPTSAKEFIREAEYYLTQCAAKDKLLADIPDTVISAWKSEISKEVLSGIISQLNEHLEQCLKLKERLIN